MVEYFSDMFDEVDTINNIDEYMQLVYCNKCNLSNFTALIGNNMKTGSMKPTTEKVLCVVDYIDQEDIKSKIILSGDRGKVIRQYLESIIPLDKIYITPMIACTLQPNSEIKDEWTSACLPRVRSIINILKPKLIVLVGNFTVRYLISAENTVRELVRKVNFYNTTPTVVVQSPYDITLMEDDERLKRATKELIDEDFNFLKEVYLDLDL